MIDSKLITLLARSSLHCTIDIIDYVVYNIYDYCWKTFKIA